MEGEEVLETFANGAKRIRLDGKTLIRHPDGSVAPSGSGIVRYLRSIDPVPTRTDLCCVSYASTMSLGAGATLS